MITCAKYVGLTIFALIILAIPSLLVLAIIYNWGAFLGFILISVVVIEILLMVLAMDALGEEFIL